MGASFLSCCEIFIQPHSLVRCKNVVWSSWYHQEQGHSLTGQTRNFSINDDKKKIWRGSLTENTQINHDCNGNPRILTRPYQRRWEGFSHLRATCVRPSLWHLHAVLSGSESDAPDWRNRANVNKAKEKNTFSFTYFLFSVAVSTLTHKAKNYINITHWSWKGNVCLFTFGGVRNLSTYVRRNMFGAE